MALLEARDLQKWYGRRHVVNGVAFEVDRGEVVGLLGPNGAGKTTSFRIVIGLIAADGGQVTFGTRDVTSLAMYQRARLGMGYLAQDSSVFKQLTVENNLMAILETQKIGRRDRKIRQDELLDQFGLKHIRKTKASQISGGERRRLEIARCLITNPKLIMLDEPFAGIDPKTVSEIQHSIRTLVQQYKIGILLTDHAVRETLEVTDRNIVIVKGEVIASGNKSAILSNQKVRETYVGVNFDAGNNNNNAGSNINTSISEHAAHRSPPSPHQQNLQGAYPNDVYPPDDIEKGDIFIAPRDHPQHRA